LELRQIRYFIQVANLRSFSKAARVLNVAQSALSRHIQGLEAELGTPLLLRTTRGVETTQAGRTLVLMGEPLLQSVAQMREAVSRTAAMPSGEVVVGMPQSISPVLAPLILHECAKSYPKLAIHVMEGLSVFLAEWLHHGKIDLAVMTNFGEAYGVRTSHLAFEELVFVSSCERGSERQPPGEITFAEVADTPIVLSSQFRRLIDRATKSSGKSLNVAIELDSIAIIKEIVSSSTHCSILPYASVRREALEGHLRVASIVEPAIRRELVLGISARMASPAAVQAVGKVISTCIKSIELSPKRDDVIERGTPLDATLTG
jgi:LysR family transcriptional regulator, nitrogen assimilation regulatory protein